MATLNAKAFVGEIRKSGDKVFVTISIPHGDKDSRKYQYLSCFVSKSLHRVFESALNSQKKEDDRVSNTLSSQVASVVIEAPFFEVNDKGFINGSGILTSLVYE
jgi:hypothetical protein